MIRDARNCFRLGMNNINGKCKFKINILGIFVLILVGGWMLNL